MLNAIGGSTRWTPFVARLDEHHWWQYNCNIQIYSGGIYMPFANGCNNYTMYSVHQDAMVDLLQQCTFIHSHSCTQKDTSNFDTSWEEHFTHFYFAIFAPSTISFVTKKHTCFCDSTFLSSSLRSDEDLSVVWKCLGKWVIHSLSFWKCHHHEWEKNVILRMRKVVNYSPREEMVKEFIQRYHKFVLSVSKFLDHSLN